VRRDLERKEERFGEERGKIKEGRLKKNFCCKSKRILL
jgi:hypothetical protein